MMLFPHEACTGRPHPARGARGSAPPACLPSPCPLRRANGSGGSFPHGGTPSCPAARGRDRWRACRACQVRRPHSNGSSRPSSVQSCAAGGSHELSRPRPDYEVRFGCVLGHCNRHEQERGQERSEPQPYRATSSVSRRVYRPTSRRYDRAPHTLLPISARERTRASPGARNDTREYRAALAVPPHGTGARDSRAARSTERFA
jgi:hypothetical protein